ncbi:hypothetical protein CEUSTIGMA_g13755.t1 [Chlamydomonas eustigma]|uniref:S-acyltransferase n=1 Tax=Chlamydomonas eustigma TaxID=1157962 RepID=A0A250XTK4_9CHLO|nr:hypothetical protein CEUSTIGMA_g13755.t1 [Chlamydomonas eustigma]|eukprot:GAX86343.1 hypothetical protein CEUSTIGMA_g13755.t1 [Chlamydomonas eustigma]
MLNSIKKVNLYVGLVLATYIYLFCVDVFCVIVPWLNWSVPGILNLVILTFSSATSLYCYLFCVFLDAGKVTEGWKPDEEASSAVQEVKRKDGAPRYCQKCKQYKPPRSHHCRVCQRCVLRMDHHCPYTNNCVGHANYRTFLVFLFYVCASLVHTIGLIAAHTLHTLQTSQEQRVIRTGPQSRPVHLENGFRNIILWAVLETSAFALALPAAIGLIMLLGWHIHLALTNKTTIEYQEGVRSRVQGVPYSEHPYDLGPYHNLHQILGENVCAWCLPPCSSSHGGDKFITVWDMAKHGLTKD